VRSLLTANAMALANVLTKPAVEGSSDVAIFLNAVSKSESLHIDDHDVTPRRHRMNTASLVMPTRHAPP
jgi:hypothetical protein